MLFDVDRDVVAAYDRWSRSGEGQRLCDLVHRVAHGGSALFFTGCGATGRLSIQLASIWRGFWQQRRAGTVSQSPPPSRWEHRAFSVMAGGDYALIKSVEGFEDSRRSAAGKSPTSAWHAAMSSSRSPKAVETSFVIGTAWQGLDAGADVVFCLQQPGRSPADPRASAAVRSSTSRGSQGQLTTGPMAVTGSTRMQATSIQLL